MEDTIVAISTALGVGAISIVRVSGKDSISIVNQIFDGKDLKKVNSHTIHYGKIVENKQEIDEVLVSVMKSPRTYTMEDIVEINCHGGIATTNKVLELLLTKGCRLARPGEFTERRFLNGKIDFIQAQGIKDLIDAKTDETRILALNQVNGKVSQMIEAIRQQILEKVVAQIEVNIDYPEYEDIKQLTNNDILPSLEEILNKMKKILAESRNGVMIKEGIKTSIIGRPNVGKSSLLNALIEENKAIVTDIEGTTRDIVEGEIRIDGISFHIIDTAGIRKSDNLVEQIGVQKSLELIENSELVLFVLNNNETLTQSDIEILDKLKEKETIIIINKKDLEQKLEIEKLPIKDCIFISALVQEGMEDVKNKMRELFQLEQIKTEDPTYLTNANSIAFLKNAISHIEDAIHGIEQDFPIDMVEIDVKTAWEELGSIIGKTYQDELIHQLFSQFCLGK
ncbi:MAG: tRNA uridine-5-carboxymethylaminomethyl(34) synthesis GTPase MnmE [Firmicutes bacterium]|nr:tRNA uridine-5-carboxymethylaminomethyl(34) synthesis GTPase MnmE [Bacillota bacterium]